LVFGVKSWAPVGRGGGRGGAADEHDDDVNKSSLREVYCHLMDDLLDSEWPYFIIKVTNTGFVEVLSAFWIEFSRAGFRDFSMTLLQLSVSFFAESWFCQKFHVRVHEVFVESTDDFPALPEHESHSLGC
jgi:hypothetical protein